MRVAAAVVIVVVVVIVVYLRTHQRHLGCLASRDGHPVGRYNPLGSRKSTPMGVQAVFYLDPLGGIYPLVPADTPMAK